MSTKLISVVIPAYNESACVEELARRLQRVFDQQSAYDFEVILVDNGSDDDTFAKLTSIHAQDRRFKVIQLARNFRTDGGVTAGLIRAKGDAAVIMSADLQDPPELISDFISEWESGYENVYGVVTARLGVGLVRRMNSQLFYWLAARLTDNRIPRNASDFRLVDRKVYETVNSMQERNRFVRGLFAWAGYRSKGIAHERPARFGGQSKADTGKVLELAVKGILAHSYLPLRMISVFGIALSLISFFVLVALTFKFVFFGVPFAGFGTIVAVNIMMFGFLFSILGVLSEYVGLIYEEVKQRPNYVIRETLGF